jgi:membrane-bound metal-dependent hydrolase YbcI (DUF457 family)
MFPVGHLSWGYISGRIVSNLMKVECNLPLLFLVSILPDVDFLIPGVIHRTITHSVIVYFLFSLPFFVKYRKKTFPYLAAVCSHSFVDYLGAPTESFWPFYTPAFYPIIKVALAITITNLELIGFFISLVYMYKTRDLTQRLLKPHPFNLLLGIPAVEILGALFFGFEFPYPLPVVLWVPHLVYSIIFSASILIDLRARIFIYSSSKLK